MLQRINRFLNVMYLFYARKIKRCNLYYSLINDVIDVKKGVYLHKA